MIHYNNMKRTKKQIVQLVCGLILVIAFGADMVLCIVGLIGWHYSVPYYKWVLDGVAMLIGIGLIVSSRARVID